MLNNRRSEIEVIENILRLTKDGAKKTQILYKNNMSYAQLNKYLTLLIEKDTIKEEIESYNGLITKTYMITKKGESLLEDITNVITHLK
jgi:predicted transcriptional regulator